MFKQLRKIYESEIVKSNAKKRAAKHAKERARLITKFQLSHEVKVLVAALTATNFVPSGEHLLANTKIITLANQDQMIMIQAHLSDGRLVKVFKEINENNLNVLAEKLTTKSDAITNVLRPINAALTNITQEWPPEREAVEAMPQFLKGVRQWLNEAGTEVLKIENI
jgi:hypothetical protein